MNITLLKQIDTESSSELSKRIKFYYTRYIRLYQKIVYSAKVRRIPVSSITHIDFEADEPFLTIVRIIAIRAGKTYNTITCEQMHQGNSYTYDVLVNHDLADGVYLFVGLTIGFLLRYYNTRYYVTDTVWAHEQTKAPLALPPTLQKRYICAISDIHIGSILFRADLFDKFVNYVNTNKTIKYLVVAGDIVDGLNVFKTQEAGLNLVTIAEQRRVLAETLTRFRPDLQIVLGPGNHDNDKGIAEPQTAIYKDVTLKHKNIITVTNPAYIRIEHLDYIIYHGRCTNSYIRDIVPFDVHKSTEIQKLLIRVGHLSSMLDVMNVAKITETDGLIIDTVPHIFHIGHTHVADAVHYKGTTHINGGTFQDLTDYQAAVGIIPTVGTCVLVNIDDIQEYEICKF